MSLPEACFRCGYSIADDWGSPALSRMPISKRDVKVRIAE